MAVDALRVQVLFSAIDRLTTPLKGMASGSKGLKADLAATRKEIVALQRAQGQVGSFKTAEAQWKATAAELKAAQSQTKAVRAEIDAAGGANAKLTKALQKAEAAEVKAGAAHEASGQKLQALSGKLERAGVDVAELAQHETKLANSLYDANKRLDQQATKLAAIEKAAARAEKVKAAGDKIAHAGDRMALGITVPSIAFGKFAFDAAGDAQELQSAFDTTFGKLAPKMNAWAEATGNAMGRSTQEMQRGANTFGIFFNQVAKADKSAEMSKRFATLAQDLGSFFNTDTQTAIDKLRSGLSGESEPLRDFGVFLNEAAVKAKLLQMKIKPVGKEFTDQQKILARYQLILEATTKAQGDVARTADSPANRLRRSRAAFEELQVTVGQKLIPALVPLIVQVTALLEAFNHLSPETQGTIVKAVALAAALGPVLSIVGRVVGAIGAMRKAYLAFKAAQAGGAILGGLSMGPLLIIVAIAAAIGVAAYLIWKHWDTIKAAFGAAWQWITAKAQQLGAVFMRFPFIFGPLGMAVAFVVRNWAAIKGAFGAGLAFLAALPGRMLQMGAQIIQGLINGITGRLAALKSSIVNAASSAANWFKAKLGIRSPSRVFMEFGGHITEGLRRGIAGGESSAVGGVDRLSRKVAGAFAASAIAATPAIASPGALTPTAPIAAPGARSTPSAAAAVAPLGPITIQIIQAPGQSPDELARIVADKLRELQGAASRSSYHDD